MAPSTRAAVAANNADKDDNNSNEEEEVLEDREPQEQQDTEPTEKPKATTPVVASDKKKKRHESTPKKTNHDDDLSSSMDEVKMPATEAPSELALDRIVDIIDFEIEHIMWERMARKDHYDTLEWFWKFYPARFIDSGCRYLRRLMAHILLETCACQPYGLTDMDMGKRNDGLEPLIKWDDGQWGGLQKSLEFLHGLMLRKDATINYMEEQDVLPDGDVVNTEREEMPVFQKAFPLLLDQISIHKALAPIRHALEVQARKIGKKSIGKRRLRETWTAISAMDDSSKVKEALLILFEENGKRIKDDTPVLRPLSKLLLILQQPPFDLCRFQNSMEHLVHRFNQIVAGGRDCALIQARYTIPPRSNLYKSLQPTVTTRVAQLSARRRRDAMVVEQKFLEELRKGREALNNSHGDDPLPAAVRASKKAGKRKATDDDGDDEDYKDNDDEDEEQDERNGKKKKTKLTIVEDIEEDEWQAAAKLSEVPKRRRQSSGVIGSKNTIPPDDGIFDEQGKVVKRHRWTDEEKLSVKEGVHKFGVGKWKEIKMEYSAILRNRSTVQIKDCWRTMTKNHEV